MDSKQLKRYGPVVAIVVVIAIIGIVVATSGGSDDDGDDTETAGGTSDSGGYVIETEWGEEITLPEGVIPFEVAERENLDIDWPATCDTERGEGAVPTYFGPGCFAPFEGDNGGETDVGVTGDSIKVVLYQGMENDPIVQAIAGAVTSDTPAESTATYEAFLPYFEEYYETYGREVELVVYEGTGNAIDEVAARADAVKIAQEIQPFAVWEGPLLTDAFADELAAQDILNIGLAGGGHQPDYYDERSPYLLQVGQSPVQNREHLAEYIGKRLVGEPAVHAGDEAFQDQERKLGLIYLTTGPESEEVVADFEDDLAEYDVELAAVESYDNPLDVSAMAPGAIAKMKDAGVTSVILTGDPLTPATFTRTATEQDYFPEWIISGAGLIDSTTYARTFDQQQWANAFGVSFGAARQDPSIASSRQLFEWYTCQEPPAPDRIALVFPIPALFFATLSGVGPDLTRENFMQTLFNADPTPRGISNPSLSWGDPEKGRWDEPDYQGVDDATEIWWDAEATGPDELDNEGAGMYRYVNGGERYLPGEWPDQTPEVFTDDGTVTIIDEVPEEEQVPDYPSPCE
jgi:hypothetical protein